MRLLVVCVGVCSLLLASLMPMERARANDPVKVFILAGQSNMTGHGKTLNGLDPNYSGTGPREVAGGIGSLVWAVDTMPGTFGFGGTDAIVDSNGDWTVRDDVSVYARMEVFQDDSPDGLTDGTTRKGAHTVGFGKHNTSTQKWNGQEPPA